jgi:hypothetical protein
MRFFDVGFTGTSDGMTNAQTLEIHMLLGDLQAYVRSQRAHHGVCIGSDAQFHKMAKAMGYLTIGHPGVNKDGQPAKRATDVVCDATHPETFYLDRNVQIVIESAILLATPKGMVEEIRSGTWQTIRSARRQKRPRIIVFPDGTSQVEGINGPMTATDLRMELACLRCG